MTLLPFMNFASRETQKGISLFIAVIQLKKLPPTRTPTLPVPPQSPLMYFEALQPETGNQRKKGQKKMSI